MHAIASDSTAFGTKCLICACMMRLEKFGLQERGWKEWIDHSQCAYPRMDHFRPV